MAKHQDWWIAKSDMTLAGRKVWKGQLIRPSGQINDHLIFGDATRWAYRWDGREAEAERCGSDGCDGTFANLGLLTRHRELAHFPERDARSQAYQQAARAQVEAEERGDTIGGYPVEQVKSGPGGLVPYVKPALG